MSERTAPKWHRLLPAEAPAEARLRDSEAREQRFRALIEHSSDLVAVVSAEGTMLYMGPSAERIVGWRSEEVEGRNVFELVHDDDHDPCRRALEAVLRSPGASVTVRYRLHHKNGSWRWMEGIGTNLIHEPAIGGLIVNTRDITDRYEAEELLRRSEERFALAVDGAKDGIWDWNMESNEFYASPRMREILGVGPDETAVLGVFEERVHPDDYAVVQELWQAHLQGMASHLEVEYRLRAGEGGYRWLLARARTVRDASGVPRRMVGSLTDVTERKRAEEESRQRQAELAHVLRVSAMDEMAAGIAHELNQPLGAIVIYAKGCAKRLPAAPPEVLAKLDEIASLALRAGEVVHGLKRIVRKEPPQRAAVDVNEVAREAVQLVRAEAADRRIALRVDLRPALPRVSADRIQIEQVVLNLLRNAIEAITRQPALVALSTRPGENGVEVAISDTGCGIAPELLERIFAPFFTTKSSGLGMGLSISRTIIEAHGGHLRADANPGAGTTFSFTLPRGEG